MMRNYQTCIDEIPFWLDCPENAIPAGAIPGGLFGNEVLYIGRALHNRALTPGSIVASENAIYLAWGYQAHKKTDFEILSGGSSDNWVVNKGGHVPVNAFIAGSTEHGESLYIGRVKHGNDILVGKIHPSFKTCYVPDIGGTKELEFHEYEVLVL